MPAPHEPSGQSQADPNGEDSSDPSSSSSSSVSSSVSQQLDIGEKDETIMDRITKIPHMMIVSHDSHQPVWGSPALLSSPWSQPST